MNDILAAARSRGITRLCHFTKSVNLSHILDVREIRPVTQLQEGQNAFRPADTQRLDAAPEYTFLSVEYPNAWYLANAASRDDNFRDWVVLTFGIELLSTPGARFCPYNAASDGSAGAKHGLAGFNAMFTPRVMRKVLRSRGQDHPAWWPTDDQAEVQIPGVIPLSAIRTVIVSSGSQARQEFTRLDQFGLARSLPPLVVAPMLFKKHDLSSAVRAGRRPPETPFDPLTDIGRVDR
ncbi:DarT ssDNA thymidine ADP-ribosyltransferase family protein [Phytomonospora endophytica]|uniref:DarT domain-containing protein n=1 Tax=Phytomonospora endophytica TaxID=714109 RepID=A0A841FQV9_9ACTN|nr:DarT ssDNA thymidine ADP-ribosyltransferase family protein [Phytomonospora endophytica]MBB6036178.1 hypothetical protein [Phytomonospora endophytica]GIG67083.1 hypothetical protein Pen01_33780 [Phytomonospora endophytica]